MNIIGSIGNNEVRELLKRAETHGARKVVALCQLALGLHPRGLPVDVQFAALVLALGVQLCDGDVMAMEDAVPPLPDGL